MYVTRGKGLIERGKRVYIFMTKMEGTPGLFRNRGDIFIEKGGV